MKLKWFNFLILTLLFPLCLSAQSFNLVKIDEADAVSGPEEPCILINPKNPNNIVAGANINRVYYSFDAGKTWQKSNPTSSFGIYGDPVFTVDTNGFFYYLHLSSPSGKGWANEDFLDRIVCQVSKDGGATWNDGTFMGQRHPKDQDKEWAVVDRRNNTIHVAWTEFDNYGSSDTLDRSRILYSNSKDTAQRWLKPQILSSTEGYCVDDSKTTEGAVPAVNSKGDVFVTWSLGDSIYFNKKTEASWMDQNKAIVGNIIGWDFAIPGMGRANGMPVLKCDLSSSPYKDRLYVNWADQRNGLDNTDIFITYSDDNGETWVSPIKVNQDNKKTHQFFTWMDVDVATGYIYIVYYDRRDYKVNSKKTHVYLSYSKDGGATFKDVKLTEKAFKSSTKYFMGDYNNISVYNGMIRPVWTELRKKQLSIWTALIEDNDLN